MLGEKGGLVQGVQFCQSPHGNTDRSKFGFTQASQVKRSYGDRKQGQQNFVARKRADAKELRHSGELSIVNTNRSIHK